MWRRAALPGIWIHSMIAITVMGSMAGWAGGQSSRPGRTVVEFKCLIPNPPDKSPAGSWVSIELRTGADAMLMRTQRMAGDIARFKDLAPGIYRICVTANGRTRCESVDLTPAPGVQAAEFTRELRLPDAAVQPFVPPRVNVHRLAIPRAALQAFEESESDYQAGDENAAKQHLERAVQIYPQYAYAWNNLGACYFRKKDYERAVRIFARVTELDRDYQLGWRNLGNSLLFSGKYQDAVVANRRAVELDPDDPMAITQLGLSYYYQRNYRESKQYFKRVLELDPAFFDSPQLLLAHIAMGEGDFSEAAALLQSFLAYHPNSPTAPWAQKTLAAIADGTVLVHGAPIRKRPGP